MTDQHRATPEQWANMQQMAKAFPLAGGAACILELRDRVEALEAAQPRPWTVTPGFKPLLPRSELVIRIIDAAKASPGGIAEVHAVIEAVAAWIDERNTSIQNQSPDHYDVPTAEDAVRWLRDEASR
jgi:hypothetical protein